MATCDYYYLNRTVAVACKGSRAARGHDRFIVGHNAHNQRRASTISARRFLRGQRGRAINGFVARVGPRQDTLIGARVVSVMLLARDRNPYRRDLLR